MVFFSHKQNDIEMIRDNDEAIKLNKINGTINVKRILSVNSKHMIYVDQYRNVRKAFLK